MKKNWMKRILSCVLSLILLSFTCLPCFAGDTYISISYRILSDSQYLYTYHLNTAYAAGTTRGSQAVFYYCPDYEGAYNIYSYGSTDMYGELYDGFAIRSRRVDADDDGGDGRNFCMMDDLEINSNYWLATRGYGNTTGSYCFCVEKNQDWCFPGLIFDDTIYEETGEMVGYLCGRLWTRTSPGFARANFGTNQTQHYRDSYNIWYLTKEECNYVYLLLLNGYMDQLIKEYNKGTDLVDILDWIFSLGLDVAEDMTGMGLAYAICTTILGKVIDKIEKQLKAEGPQFFDSFLKAGKAEKVHGLYVFKQGVKIDYYEDYFYPLGVAGARMRVSASAYPITSDYTRLIGQEGVRGTWTYNTRSVPSDIIQDYLDSFYY